jgi:hypothetical protein
MQQILQSVCQVLQQDKAEQHHSPSRTLHLPAATGYLSRHPCSTLQPPAGPAAGSPRQAWVPGGKSSCIASAGASAGRGPARSPSYRLTGAGGGGGAREAARESVLGRRALEERRKRLQSLYTDLQQQG